MICVRAYDKSHRLQRNRRSATFQDMTLSDVVQKVVGERAPGRHDRLDVDGAPVPAAEHGVRPRLHQSPRGARELRVRGRRGPRVPATAAQRQRPRADAGLAQERQVVQAAHERGAAARHGQGHELRPGHQGRRRRRGHRSPGRSRARRRRRATRRSRSARSELLVSDRVANTADEARTIAQSTLDKLASGSFEAEGTMEGDPAVKAGGKLKLEGFTSRFDGEYQVTSVTHVYGHSDFRTRFSISGRNPRTLSDVMRPKAERDWNAGLVIGLVTNIQDPESLGRVRVQVPDAGRQHRGHLGARRAARRRPRRRHVVHAPDRRRGRRRLRARRHAPPGRARRPAQRGRQAARRRCAAPTTAARSSIYGREDAEIDLQEAARDHRQGHAVITVDGGDDGQGDMQARERGQVRAQGRDDDEVREHGRDDDQEQRRHHGRGDRRR